MNTRYSIILRRGGPMSLEDIGAAEELAITCSADLEVQRFHHDSVILLGDCFSETGGPRGLEIAWNDENARELIERFTLEAFRRRPPTPAYIDGLVGYFEKQRALDKPFQIAMIDTLAIVLSSPAFLFMNETEQPDSRDLAAL
ncbi:DUF1595 domain-containing protein, partial [Sphingobium sp.]|uniref:DUF1595 domain-containing protein n=1 Tax=Sphingobium sp. TaxID=1912891 RepID=UPI0035C73B66